MVTSSSFEFRRFNTRQLSVSNGPLSSPPPTSTNRCSAAAVSTGSEQLVTVTVTNVSNPAHPAATTPVSRVVANEAAVVLALRLSAALRLGVLTV
jgi:hypothetical protein